MCAAAKLALRVALAPAELAARVALDALFGKEQEFEFTGSTCPAYGTYEAVSVRYVDSAGVVAASL